MQQLTLTTWRLAARTLERALEPSSIVEFAAVHAVLARLRDVDDPLQLFSRHATAHNELSMVLSLVGGTSHQDLAYDLLDGGFLARWNELVANGGGPEELPPLRRQTATTAPRE
ncbi:MAG TPA: hypothetical protein VFG86_08780 [Chloroflexota bacterium]|nr:hypothetical protein [Chloroflexota bacterium]